MTVIEFCKQAEKQNSIRDLKKLKGYRNAYRIKIGSYRIGLVIENDILIFTRFLHRKDIYNYFP